MSSDYTIRDGGHLIPDGGAAGHITIASDPASAHLDVAHVATLPDGTRVNLPAGSVLREGSDETAWTLEGRPFLPPNATITFNKTIGPEATPHEPFPLRVPAADGSGTWVREIRSLGRVEYRWEEAPPPTPT